VLALSRLLRAGGGKRDPTLRGPVFLSLLFDTVTNRGGLRPGGRRISGPPPRSFHDQLLEYHRLFDIYKQL
jgi:hypothetical protein